MKLIQTLFLLLVLFPICSFATAEFPSHPPMRPLPSATPRSITSGRGFYTDPRKGNDHNPGTRLSPWKTVNHAVSQLQAGDVLYLRGGVYFEHVRLQCRGTNTKPITIRSYPNELAIIDGGIREFYENPATAWQPCSDGAPQEYCSVKLYPLPGARPGQTNLLGHFADSMIPLHGYRFLNDFRTANEYFYKLNARKSEPGQGVYCGPGLYYNTETTRIHVRLAHTQQTALGNDNYRGETDPRKLRLIIASQFDISPLSIDQSRYLRIQDLVVRGARNATISVTNSQNIEFSNVTSYGGASAFSVKNTAGLRLWNCALRGIAAPWTFRGSLKYRAIEARIFSASTWQPTGRDNRDFELAYCEFTDSVDGVFIGNVRNVHFHHNLLDNISDDGIFLTATTAYDGITPGGNVHIYQNLLSRCLTTFAFGVGHGRQKMTARGRQTGAGVSIYRNVFDFRRPVMYAQPKENESELPSYGRLSGDHGSPLWEPMRIYHNTILHVEPPWRNYYLGGLGGHLAPGSRRALFNNIIVHAAGNPGVVLPQAKLAAVNTQRNNATTLIDFQTDGNLHWSYQEKPTRQNLFARFLNSVDFAASRNISPAGWITHDLVQDPLFHAFAKNWQQTSDCRLTSNSPAINNGIRIPDDWPDPLRKTDEDKPDIGAIPFGVAAWPVGKAGRLRVTGAKHIKQQIPDQPESFLVKQVEQSVKKSPPAKPAVIVKGYPAFDAPLFEFILNRHQFSYESLERTWLNPREYQKYGLIIVAGDLRRAKIEPYLYSVEDLNHVKAFLQNGGTLILLRRNHSLFSTEHGREFFSQLTGTKPATQAKLKILQPKHRWVKHLDSSHPYEWMNARSTAPITVSKGEQIIGSPTGSSILYRLPVGKGQLIYIGWEVSAALPHGRKPSTVEMEQAYEQQLQILTNIIGSITK